MSLLFKWWYLPQVALDLLIGASNYLPLRGDVVNGWSHP